MANLMGGTGGRLGGAVRPEPVPLRVQVRGETALHSLLTLGTKLAPIGHKQTEPFHTVWSQQEGAAGHSDSVVIWRDSELSGPVVLQLQQSDSRQTA